MSRISRILLAVLSNMHLLFNASGETVAKGREREGKCKFIYWNNSYYNIFLSIFKLNLKLQPVFMNISDCMVFIIKKKSVLIYVINGKTFGQRKTNFWQCNDKISMWILNTFIWWECQLRLQGILFYMDDKKFPKSS